MILPTPTPSMQICIYFRKARPPASHTVSFFGQQSGLHSSKTGLFYWKTNTVQSPATYWLPSTAMTITIDMLIETVRCLMPLLISFILLILTLLSMWLHVVQCWKAFATPITAMGRRQCLPFSWTTLTKPSLKIGSVNKAFLFWYWQRLQKYFFGMKFFCFSR